MLTIKLIIRYLFNGSLCFMLGRGAPSNTSAASPDQMAVSVRIRYNPAQVSYNQLLQMPKLEHLLLQFPALYQ